MRACEVGAVLALIALSGCSTYDSLIGTKPSAAPTASAPASTSSSSSFSDRFNNLLLGGPATTAAAGPSSAAQELDCPAVEIRQGAATFAQSAPGSDAGALSLRYQANFVRTARECALRGGNVTLKVGIQGRVILGPAGVPGPVTLPVRLALVKEGLEPSTVWTKFYAVPVTIPPGAPNVLFTHVEEDMTVPMPPGSEFDKYVVYVGFDPEGAVPEKKKPTKPAPKPRR